MKTLNNMQLSAKRRAKWSLFGALLLSLAVGSVGHTGASEGMGGLPGHGGGAGGLGLGNLSRSPSFTLEGNYQEVVSALISVSGTGSSELTDLGGGVVRWRFNGDLDIELNESRLGALGAKMAVEASESVGTTNGVIAWAGGVSPTFSILPGAVLPLSYERMVDCGLLSSPATLHFFAPAAGRTTMSFDSNGGVLTYQLRN